MHKIIIPFNIMHEQCMYAPELMRAHRPERVANTIIFLLLLTIASIHILHDWYVYNYFHK